MVPKLILDDSVFFVYHVRVGVVPFTASTCFPTKAAEMPCMAIPIRLKFPWFSPDIL